MGAEIRIRPIKVEMSVRLGVGIRLKWDKLELDMYYKQ